MYTIYFDRICTKHFLISTEITRPHSFHLISCSSLMPQHHKPLISIWFQCSFRSPWAPSCLSFYFLPSFVLLTVGPILKIFSNWKENYSRTQRTYPVELPPDSDAVLYIFSFHGTISLVLPHGSSAFVFFMDCTPISLLFTTWWRVFHFVI